MTIMTQPTKTSGIQQRQCQEKISKPINAYIKKSERAQIDNLMSALNELEKQEQIKLKPSKRKEIIKIRAELNEIETTRKIQKITETKCWFFKKINKIDRPLVRFSKKRENPNKLNQK